MDIIIVPALLGCTYIIFVAEEITITVQACLQHLLQICCSGALGEAVQQIRWWPLHPVRIRETEINPQVILLQKQHVHKFLLRFRTIFWGECKQAPQLWSVEKMSVRALVHHAIHMKKKKL